VTTPSGMPAPRMVSVSPAAPLNGSTASDIGAGAVGGAGGVEEGADVASCVDMRRTATIEPAEIASASVSVTTVNAHARRVGEGRADGTSIAGGTVIAGTTGIVGDTVIAGTTGIVGDAVIAGTTGIVGDAVIAGTTGIVGGTAIAGALRASGGGGLGSSLSAPMAPMKR
jgi:hypothetical protein